MPDEQNPPTGANEEAKNAAASPRRRLEKLREGLDTSDKSARDLAALIDIMIDLV